MTATEELRKLLDERGVEHIDNDDERDETTEPLTTTWEYIQCGYEMVVTATEARDVENKPYLDMDFHHYFTPEQAISATLGDDDYERKMDALLCRLTNGKFSKSRQYDLDFMESCVNEEFEKLYEDELADAALGSDERYDAGFANGVKATLQQLDGLIYEGADIDEIQGWIDRQWEEES